MGRWASSDPIAIHAQGGGEALNSFHYVGGTLLGARDVLGLGVVAADLSGHIGSPELGADVVDVAPHRATEQADPMVAARQGLDRLDMAEGLRSGYRDLYANMARDARASGASADVVARIQREGQLVVASIVGFQANADGQYELVLDTSQIDSELGGETNWSYARLREAVEDQGTDVYVGFERPGASNPDLYPEHASGPYPSHEWSEATGPHVIGPAGAAGTQYNAQGQLWCALRPSLQSFSHSTTMSAIGRALIHEIDLHAVPAMRSPGGDACPHQSRSRLESGPRSTSDLGDDYLRHLIPLTGRDDERGPFQTPPAWNWSPDSPSISLCLEPAQ